MTLASPKNGPPLLQTAWKTLPSLMKHQTSVLIYIVQVDLKSGEGLHEAFAQFGPLDAVVNCAAISSPAACEKDPETARWGRTYRAGWPSGG